MKVTIVNALAARRMHDSVMKNESHDIERTRTVDIVHAGGFRFDVQFGASIPSVTADEPPPLGEGTGPDAARLLAGAIGNCLSASLLLCLQKSRAEVRDLRASVTLTLGRNDAGRLRVTDGRVRIAVDVDDEAKLARCAKMFEDYCIVTATVRSAFPIEVRVVDAAGREIPTREATRVEVTS
jgi:uncharacterized OsmC-like protein